MINSYDEYFKIDRNQIPLRNQQLSRDLKSFLRDKYRIKLKYPEIWKVIKNPEFRESLKVKIPKELYDIEGCEGDKLYPMSSIFQYPNQEEYKKYMYKKYIEFRNAFLPGFEDYIEYLDDYKIKHKIYGIIDETPFVIGYTYASGVYYSKEEQARYKRSSGDKFSLVRVFTTNALSSANKNIAKWWDDSDPKIKESTMALMIEFINQEEFILKNQKIAS